MYDKHLAYQNLTYFRSKSKSFDSGVNIENKSIPVLLGIE